MKKCQTCDKTFEDSMRFCQVDGTPLVDDAPAFDPYATIVAQPIPKVPAPEPEPAAPADEPAQEQEIHYTVGSIPISEPDDLLDLPSSDPLKTMYVSDSEMQAALGKDEPEIIEIPPIEEASQPEPPSFIASEPAKPSDPAPPPSPFEPAPPPSPFAVDEESASPSFGDPEPPAPVFESPEPEKFSEAPTMMQSGFSSQFDPPPAPIEPWTPPPAPDANWQNKEVGSNTPFQPPPAGVEGQNKTLAIVSLVSGILGLTLCCGTLIPSVVAVITGFMARGKAASDPTNFGGGGLAMGGLITGGIGVVLNLAYLIFLLFFGGLSLLMGQ